MSLKESRLEQLLFLPGAGGDRSLWQPVASRLAHRGPRELVTWPGFGGTPPDPTVTGLEDLAARVLGRLTGPAILFAQSMGGIVALQVALSAPSAVRALVLSVTSGGIDLSGLGVVDWRPQFERNHPDSPRWFLDARTDLTHELQRIRMPTLLLWGDADPISPVSVGRRLNALLPNAELVVIPGGTHELVSERADEVLPHIERHLLKVLPKPAD
jgi:pimeloyl-ACP methyl ester carboxylesterase